VIVATNQAGGHLAERAGILTSMKYFLSALVLTLQMGPVTAQNPAATGKPEAVKKQLGKGVWLEAIGKQRRVLVDATVCMREGEFGLECLLCRSQTKEHESILHTDADAKFIHAGLLVAGATPGSPVRYEEKNGSYVTIPPTGPRIKITLEYRDKGKLISVPAQSWVRNDKSRKEMQDDWVFTGSQLWDNPTDKTKPRAYAATIDGAYICISNVPTALLDLPINSPRAIESRSFEPFTEHIPPKDTHVTILLELIAK
jgi:hypothetical protein